MLFFFLKKNLILSGGYTTLAVDDYLQSLLFHATGLNEEQCDKVADLICAGESISSLLASVKFEDDSSSSDSSDARNRSTMAEKGERKMDMLADDVDREARSLQESASKRIDVWNSWLTRCEKEGEERKKILHDFSDLDCKKGDEFRAILASSKALAESIDSVLVEALKKPEILIFQVRPLPSLFVFFFLKKKKKDFAWKTSCTWIKCKSAGLTLGFHHSNYICVLGLASGGCSIMLFARIQRAG